ncbi:MAG: hypothetical protein ACK4SF_18525 [Algoriphagus aquaeductus]|uniref:hypothetical protein n=1 Tax=Algoriphagus aquaeductus TaxID=475299 RepID=UPI00391C926D
MIRLTHPYFKLFCAGLIDVFQQGKMKEFTTNARNNELLRNLKFNAEQLPVALRWNMHPEFGFPRAPFSVYRRFADYSSLPLRTFHQSASIPINGELVENFNEEIYLLSVGLTLSPGQLVTVTPLGKGGIRLLSKKFTLQQSGTILFKSPFMEGLVLEGQGTLNQLSGIPQQPILDAKNWDRIQVVGLPFRKGEVKNQGYNGDPQGFDPHALTDAKTAAYIRLLMGEWLYTSPPSLQGVDAQVPDFPWNFPNPGAYLHFLENGPDSQLSFIKQCLEKSDDHSYQRERRQPGYLLKTSIPGISQKGSLGTAKTAEALIPVVAQTLLSISSENPASLGLGFGTYDFLDTGMLRQWNNPNYARALNIPAIQTGLLDMAVDYMVGANYVIRPMGEFKFPIFDQLSKQVEFCALGEEAPSLVNVQQLEALGIQKNRPEIRDAIFTESVKLRWKQPDYPSGYGIAVSYQSGSSKAENDHFPFDKDAYFSIFSPVPKNLSGDIDEADKHKTVHALPEEPLPFTGSRSYKYFVAPWDVFGRWGPWTRKLFTAQAPEKQKPGIMEIRLQVAEGVDIYELDPAIPSVNCTLEIVFSWDWIDRSPLEIQIAGSFYHASQINPPLPNFSRFDRTHTDTSTPVISIQFNNSGINQTPSSNLGAVHLMESSIPVDSSGDPTFGSQDSPSSNLRKYKLIIPGITSHFPGISPFEVAYTASIRGLESVRATANDWSDWTNGYVTRLPDPRPPAKIYIPADVQLTAFPDATRIAKGLFTWPAANGALFYHIWEASEIGIRTLLEPALKGDFPGNPDQHLLPLSESLVARASQLRDLLNQEKYSQLCQKAFSRLTKNPLSTRQFQVELPGSSEILYLYSISSVNSANMESKKSNPAFFAVPRVSVPEPPVVQVVNHPTKGSDGSLQGLEVRVFTTGGIEPEGYQLYRIRKIPLNNEVGAKGLPIIEEDSPLWEDFSFSMLDGTVYTGKRYFETALTRSWRPLVYQAVAVGKKEAERGVSAGESEGSSTQVAWYPPKSPPSLLLLSAIGNSFSQVFSFSTSAPFESISLGKTKLELYQLGSDGGRTLISTFVGSETPLSTADLPLAGNAGESAALPKVNHQKMDLPTGLVRFSLAIPASSETHILRIIDPLDQVSEIEINS